MLWYFEAFQFMAMPLRAVIQLLARLSATPRYKFGKREF
jgi:hypothetical protein